MMTQRFGHYIVDLMPEADEGWLSSNKWGEVQFRLSDIDDLRRALAWAESELASVAGQPRLPLEVPDGQ